METILLKSRIGQFTATWRPMIDNVPRKYVYDWNFDNDFKVRVSSKWWENFHDKVFDPQNGLRYRDAFLPL